MVFLDGAYQTVGAAAPVFRPVAAPELRNLQKLVEQIAGRIGRSLERRGLVERDLENAWLAADTEAGPLDDLLGHSITYRIAVGPRAGSPCTPAWTLRRISETGAVKGQLPVAEFSGDTNTALETIIANFPQVVAAVVWPGTEALPVQNGMSAFITNPKIVNLGALPAP